MPQRVLVEIPSDRPPKPENRFLCRIHARLGSSKAADGPKASSTLPVSTSPTSTTQSSAFPMLVGQAVSTASGMCCANAALFECKKKKNTHFNPGFWGQKETTLVSEHRVKRMNELGHHLGTKLTCRQRDVQEVVGQHISRKEWHDLTAGSTTPNSSFTTSASFAISRHGRLEVTLRSAEAEACWQGSVVAVGMRSGLHSHGLRRRALACDVGNDPSPRLSPRRFTAQRGTPKCLVPFEKNTRFKKAIHQLNHHLPRNEDGGNLFQKNPGLLHAHLKENTSNPEQAIA